MEGAGWVGGNYRVKYHIVSIMQIPNPLLREVPPLFKKGCKLLNKLGIGYGLFGHRAFAILIIFLIIASSLHFEGWGVEWGMICLIGFQIL